MQFTLISAVFTLFTFFLGSINAENVVAAFSASREEGFKATHNDQVIPFGNVQTNIGHHYNSGTGIFTVPVDGVYIFQWTILTTNGHVGDTSLVVNGEMKRRNAADSNGYFGYRAGSAAVVLSLKQKERVWKRAKKDKYIEGGNFSSFQGWLQYDSPQHNPTPYVHEN